MSNALHGKVAIVTGASTGIGRATAKLFAAEGAAVVLAARSHAVLAELAESIERSGGRAAAVAGDVTEEVFAETLVNTAMRHFGGLDVAFNNAGAIHWAGPVADMPLSAWNEVVATNLSSAFLGAKYQLPALIAGGGGSIIFTSTFVGYTAGIPGLAAYAAAKSGLVGLTQVLASEHGAQGVRVNALLPGGTDTPAGRAFADTPEKLAFVRGLHALKRIATPEEIARAALYLASDASSFTTGSAMLVDGGASINRV